MQLAGGMRLSKWIRVVEISKMTAWRWRKEGKAQGHLEIWFGLCDG
jgi:hypothetical protein